MKSLPVLLLVAAFAAVSAKEPAKAEILVVKVLSVTPEGVVAVRNRGEQVKKIFAGDETVAEKTKKVLAISNDDEHGQYQSFFKVWNKKNPGNKKLARSNALADYGHAIQLTDKDLDGKVVFIATPDTSEMVDDQDLTISGKRDGTYKYMSAAGAAKTVPRYAAVE